MKSKLSPSLIRVHLCSSVVLLCLSVGCTAINTKDVTEIDVTTTGLKLGQNPINQTAELSFGRQQVRYMKIPTGLNATNASATDVTKTPAFVSSYEANTHSAVFGNASLTTTTATDAAGVNSLLGGMHLPINTSTGTNNAPPPPVTTTATGAAASTLATPAIPTAAK